MLSIHILVFILSMSAGRSSPSLQILSSCTSASTTEWNTDSSTMGPAVRSWLHSVVTVREEKGTDSVQSMLYHPDTGQFGQHFSHYNDQMEQNSNLMDNDTRVVTISNFVNNVPTGLSWQWRSKRMTEGFLYGEVDSKGQFTGEKITFVYPDFLTGLRGEFSNGELLDAIAVDIVGERCAGGKKELLLEPAGKDGGVRWKKEETDHRYTGQHPQVMDPYERKSVYVGQSLIPGSGEGLFARRYFLPGDIVSYFGGTKTYSCNMFFDNLTDSEESSTAAYFFKLGTNLPDRWGYPDNMVLDVPEQYRSIYQYRTTLGHKANHLFKGKNTEYDTVHHPVQGGIVFLEAIEAIQPGEEIIVDYWYQNIEGAEPWYRDLYYSTYGEIPEEEDLDNTGHCAR